MKKLFLVLWGFIMSTLPSHTLEIYYNRIDENYDGWRLWIWNKTDGLEGFEILPQSLTNKGLLFILDTSKYSLENKEIGILPKFKDWQDKESFDRILKYTDQKEIYIFEGDPKIYTSLFEVEKSTKIIAAYYDGDEIRVVLNRGVFSKDLQPFILENKEQTEQLNIKHNPRKTNVIYLKLREKIDLEKIREGEYWIKSQYGNALVRFGKAIYSITPPEDKLGEIFDSNSILFRVFSTAKDLNLVLKKDGEDKQLLLPFKYRGNFIWEITISTSYYGWLYRYMAIYPDKTLYGIDPYASVSVYNNKWAMIYKDNFKVTPLANREADILKNVIYEMNIRDFTIDNLSGVKHKGKYLGLCEDQTHHPSFNEIKTALSHLIELGVNAVHIMPFYDFEKDEESDSYDWGYMPVSFNSPDGWFAENKKEGKIKEAKMMINTLHKNGIRIIMDVVYNHTAETKEKVYNFNALAPDYYYRTKEDGSYYNGSGCGNEFKTESPFGRRFIIDSLKYWVEEYGIDGFRFDLMGLIDLETVDEILKELKKIKPEIIIYGEPWHAGGTPIKGVSKGAQKGKGYAVFNDDIRDAIKGNVFNINDLGYVQSGNYRDKVIKGIKASIDSFTDSPSETINYVSCHDNHTLYDRLKLSMPNDDESTTISRLKLAQTIVALSQGIYFIHSGEEFIRTKKGNENSYNAGDEINMIEWTNKKIHFDLFSYHKDLIKIKKEHAAFRLKNAQEIRKRLIFFDELKIPLPHPSTIGYIIKSQDLDPWGDIIVLINPLNKRLKFEIPQGNWKIRFNKNGRVEEEIGVEKYLYVEAISAIILSSH